MTLLIQSGFSVPTPDVCVATFSHRLHCTVGQFGTAGCRIKSTWIFFIFSHGGWCSSMSVLIPSWLDTKITTCLCWPIARRALGQPPGPMFCLKICIFLRYAYITPTFLGQTDLTQWGHISPISWGNFGYLRFSGRWPFGRSAGRFLVPIAQSDPWQGQKCKNCRK